MMKPCGRVTTYLDPDLHRFLKFKAAETSRSVADLVNEAVRHELAEDQEDLRDARKREREKTVSYEEVLKLLKNDGKI